MRGSTEGGRGGREVEEPSDSGSFNSVLRFK